MTKGQIEAKISQAVTKFEIDIMGRGPKQINTSIVSDLIIIRLEGFFSASEKRLAENNSVELIKKVRTLLFENEEENFKNIIEEIVDNRIVSLHSDVSTKTGEKIIILTMEDNLEEKLR
ncbi:MAG: DUF2294 domain-containing protein [Halothermotrichaceae bacterium]